MNRARSAALVSCLAALAAAPAHAQYVVRHSLFSAGAALAGDGRRVLGVTVGQPFAGLTQGGSGGGSLGFWYLVGSVGAGPGGPHPLVTEYYLGRSFPNPFRESTLVHYELPATASVRLSIYDSNGRKVRRLFDGDSSAGTHDLPWDGRDDDGRPVPAGMYFSRIQAPGFLDTRKLVRIE